MGWQYDPRRNTYLDYNGCQAGLETDGRCHELGCKFLCFRSEAPSEEIPIMKLLCPRENEVDARGSVVIISGEG